MVLECILLVLISLINPQLKLIYSSPLSNATNHILVDVKLKERIEIVTYKKNVCPSLKDHQNIISNNQKLDTRVTVHDINRSEAIYGPRVAILKVKKYQKIPQHVHKVSHIPLPSLLIEHHKNE